MECETEEQKTMICSRRRWSKERTGALKKLVGGKLRSEGAFGRGGGGGGETTCKNKRIDERSAKPRLKLSFCSLVVLYINICKVLQVACTSCCVLHTFTTEGRQISLLIPLRCNCLSQQVRAAVCRQASSVRHDSGACFVLTPQVAESQPALSGKASSETA